LLLRIKAEAGSPVVPGAYGLDIYVKEPDRHLEKNLLIQIRCSEYLTAIFFMKKKQIPFIYLFTAKCFILQIFFLFNLKLL
jgi:hypothetical protein